MARTPTPKNLIKAIGDVNRRLEALATGAHPTIVEDGGYGRNRGWAEMRLRSPVTVTNGGGMRWCIVNDNVLIEAYGGLLDVSGIDAPNSFSYKPVEIARIHEHGWPQANMPWVRSVYLMQNKVPVSNGGSWGYPHADPLIQMTTAGRLMQMRPRLRATGLEQDAYSTVNGRVRFAFRMAYPLG